MRSDVEVVSCDAGTHELAEGPYWDAPRQRLLWVDIPRGHVVCGRLDRVDVRAERRWQFRQTVGVVVCAVDGDLLVAAHRSLHRGGPHGPARRILEQDSRWNDGACDPAGRFLVGTKSLGPPPGRELLVRVEDDLSVTVLDDDLTLSNGLDWSPDGQWLYSVDSLRQVVFVRPYDPESARTGARRVLLEIDDGYPDGLTVDADGNVWVAMFGAGQVRCFTPAGRLIGVIDLPVPQPSSVAFAGPDLTTLVITTGREELTDEEVQRFPRSGTLFTAVPGVRGRSPTPWNGHWPT